MAITAKSNFNIYPSNTFFHLRQNNKVSVIRPNGAHVRRQEITRFTPIQFSALTLSQFHNQA